MRIVPVLDLMGGLVVRARFGARDGYRPIETPLSPDPQPLHVAAGLMALHRFDALYVADLDAILGRGTNRLAIEDLRAAFPGIEIWVDAGFADPADAGRFAAATGARPVVGSESLSERPSRADYGRGTVLSLDFRGGDFQGPEDLLARPEDWPEDVIAMTLAQVGSGAGPDLPRLAAIKAAAGEGRRVFAAGGVRDLDDLRALAAAGIAGALVATALHDGRLDAAALAAASTGA